MRYILNDSGFIETISFDYQVECNNKKCTEYTGSVPTGYENLAEWSDNANINAYKIVGGNLTYDSAEDTRLQNLWASQGTAVNKSGNFIRVAMNNDLTLTNTDVTTIKFDKVSEQLGDGLSLTNDGGIKIGSYISAVRVSGQVYFYNGTENKSKRIYIAKNTSQKSSTNTGTSITNYTQILTPQIPMNVIEGDVIYLQIEGASSDVFKNYSSGTFLIVEVIK